MAGQGSLQASHDIGQMDSGERYIPTLHQPVGASQSSP
jgi:hypothetical protein